MRIYGNKSNKSVAAPNRSHGLPTFTANVPDNVKVKVQQNTGVDLSDVSVEHNSPKPFQICAAAYTQGNNVYLGPGQERHLNHELGHVVQQKSGMVSGGASINENPMLERDAEKALESPPVSGSFGAQTNSSAQMPIQRVKLCLNDVGTLYDRNEYDEIPVAFYQRNELDGQGNAGVRAHVGIDAEQAPSDNFEKAKENAKELPPLAPDENIIFYGHGDSFNVGDLNMKQIAQVAAHIPKPDDWHGKILLYSCWAANGASMLADEYFTLTGHEVDVIAPKDKVAVFSMNHPSKSISKQLSKVIDSIHENPNLPKITIDDIVKNGDVVAGFPHHIQKSSEEYSSFISHWIDTVRQINQRIDQFVTFFRENTQRKIPPFNQDHPDISAILANGNPNMFDLIDSLEVNDSAILANGNSNIFDLIDSLGVNDLIKKKVIELFRIFHSDLRTASEEDIVSLNNDTFRMVQELLYEAHSLSSFADFDDYERPEDDELTRKKRFAKKIHSQRK